MHYLIVAATMRALPVRFRRLQMNGALLVVPAGSLDGDVPMRPNGHIFSASRATWDQGLESIPSFAKFPE